MVTALVGHCDRSSDYRLSAEVPDNALSAHRQRSEIMAEREQGELWLWTEYY
jgi:hypothetical protein